MAKTTAAQAAASERYKRKNYDRILLQFPAGSRDRLKAAATAAGFRSVNAWIAALLERETGDAFTLRGELPHRNKRKIPAENPAEQTEK